MTKAPSSSPVASDPDAEMRAAARAGDASDAPSAASPSAYPACSEEAVARFREHGFLCVDAAVTGEALHEVELRCQPILDHKDKLAFDWAWQKGTPREERAFKIVQGSPSMIWREISETRFRNWMIEYASVLMGRPVEFWYDQFLAKPPHEGAETHWHQDEAYWGRNLDDRGITCWMPLQDVDETNGCMHFVDAGHLDGILEHAQPPHVQSDLIACAPDLARVVACPIARGSVTFHHGKTPHMSTPNRSGGWRKAVTTHMRVAGSLGEGDHYPWKVYVNQVTGERTVPPSR